jgi:hypothetical protein
MKQENVIFPDPNLSAVPPISGVNQIDSPQLPDEENLPTNSQSSNQDQKPKKNNKLTYVIVAASSLFLLLTIVLILSLAQSPKPKKKVTVSTPTPEVQAAAQSTQSALLKQIKDKVLDLEEEVNDDNFEELDVSFPLVDWQVNF